MKKIFMISIMVFMSVAMFGQDLRKIAKETIMEKLSEWSLPTSENYHKLKALGINADSLAYVKIDVSLYCPSPSSYPIEKFIDSQKDTVIVKHYKVLGKEKTDTVNAVVCTGTKYDFPYFLIREATFSISYHYIETYVIFDYQNNVIGIAMKVYKYFMPFFNEENGVYSVGLHLVSTIKEIQGGEKFCEINDKRITEGKRISTLNIPYYSAVKRYAESKDNKKKTKHRDNRVDDVY